MLQRRRSAHNFEERPIRQNSLRDCDSFGAVFNSRQRTVAMTNDTSSDKVLKALDWQPQKKASQVITSRALLLSARRQYAKCTKLTPGLTLQAAFDEAVQDSIDALGLEVRCQKQTA
jgi:hypothetical protein